MKGLRVGHDTNAAHGTGVTAFLFDQPAVGAYCVCGSSPATQELPVLDLDTHVTHVDGLLFAGGSALGLSAVAGVQRWLVEQGRGWNMPHGAVPIVPAAAIYDLAIKEAVPPTAEEAYRACSSATENNTESGRLGAGTGATVGKLILNASRMSGGVGYAEMHLPNGVVVLAYVVVNSVGDVRDSHGKIITGARLSNGEFADVHQLLLSGQHEARHVSQNTTLVALFTNARFSNIELKRIAKMATAGIARAIYPIFTCYDGDVVFCFSLGDHVASEVVVGTVAADIIQQAIVDAVKHSVVIE
jgi:L-aminopeptidase/D-esterase-like protein